MVIPAGETTANITVAPIYDLLLEGNETVILTLKPNGYALDGLTNATVTISDYDDGLRKTPVLSAGLATNAHYGRFFRGTGIDPSYQSFLVTVDFQQGVALDNSNVWLDLAGALHAFHWCAPDVRRRDRRVSHAVHGTALIF